MGTGPTARRVRLAGIAAAAAAAMALLTATPAGAAAGFGDVPDGAFYAEPVQWMVDNGVTSGTSEGCFSPDASTTRGMAATFLHRVAGEPAAGPEPFTDVSPGEFFHTAVAWMVDEGITTGASPTTFEPYRVVTRGEMATFLHRAAGEPAGGGESFVDVSPGDFFAEAVAWMVAEGITSGASPTTFEPHRPISRGEIATFMHRAAGSPSVTLAGDGQCGPTGHEAELAEAEARSLQLLNEYRVANGQGALTRNATMDAFARNWSEAMDAPSFFQHSDGPWAENIAWWSAGWATPTAAAEQVHEMWINSTGHRNNMLRSSHALVGIGFWQDGSGWHATHVFD